MALGPIPWTAINQYARTQGVIDEEYFTALIREMEAVENKIHEQDKKATEPGGKPDRSQGTARRQGGGRK